jgi:nuclear pore complex protein Nup53
MEDAATPASAQRAATPPGVGTPTPLQAPPPPLQLLGGSLPAEQPQPAYDDDWVTVFGFSEQDLPLVLAEFQQCGDIVTWQQPMQSGANFVHIR